MPFRRAGRPGLIGTAARTAVVAGTATATVGAVQRRQANRQQQAYEAEAYEQMQAQQAYAEQAQAYAPPPPPPPAPAAPAPAAAPGLADQLAQLASMHAAGILSDEEFTAAKARLVG